MAWSYRDAIFGALLLPATQALGPGEKLQAIAPSEIFFTYLKSTLLVGFVVSLPVFFWQVWGFVSPGLYPSEKRVAVPFVGASTLLFAGGAYFGYRLVFPVVFAFFASFRSSFVEPSWTMSEVFSLTTQLVLAFGVCFEVPVLIFFLVASGIVEARQLLGWTKYAVLVAFVAAAILTPTPDAVTQTLLAGPLIALYLLGIAVAWLFSKRKPAPSAEKQVATSPSPP